MDQPGSPSEDYAITHPLRPILLASMLSLLQFILTCGLIYSGVRDVRAARVAWVMIYIAAFVGFWVAANLIMAARRPSPKERAVIWRWLAIAIILGCHIAALGVIWSVMPHLSVTAQLMIALFLVNLLPAQIICSPENVLANRSGVITVLGSLAVFLGTREPLIERLVALYIISIAVLLLVLSGTLNRTVREVVAARLASDAAATRLDQMLAEVAAQRDAGTKFIASASHDLGQPLQAAALFFDQSLRAPAGAARDAAIDGVRNAHAAADVLLAHMLGHFSLQADAVRPHLSSVSLPLLLRRVAARHEATILEKGVRFRVSTQPLVLALDPSLIDRALSNLITNALTHSGAGRVLLAARAKGADAVRIWVIDDGVGVSRVDAKHIFDDYYQGSGANRGAPGGFGLGLASARRLATLMDGLAGLDPRWLRGAAFYLEFPANGSGRRVVRDDFGRIVS